MGKSLNQPVADTVERRLPSYVYVHTLVCTGRIENHDEHKLKEDLIPDARKDRFLIGGIKVTFGTFCVCM